MRPEIQQAVLLLQRGDDEALEQALALLQNTVFSFSMRICGQREDAEDTMQEVLLKSVPHLPKFESPKALVVWLYKVAKNRCLMSRRRSKFAPKEDLSLEELMPDRGELQRLSGDRTINPENLAIRSEEAARLSRTEGQTAINFLPGVSPVYDLTGLRIGVGVKAPKYLPAYVQM
jgi:RNA polymerase sigma-70 factor (ECF subfamily)